jgi:formylmethanofuran dehydrogenase subunit B
MQTTDDLSKPVRLGALSMAKVTRALLDGPCSIRELQVISGLSTNTLHEYMRALRKERVVHIGAWEKDATGRESLRVFKFGPGKDQPRAKKSKALIARECRQRKQDAKLSHCFVPIDAIEVSPRRVIRPRDEAHCVHHALA